MIYLRVMELLSQYISDLGNKTILTKEEEHKLALEIKAGDKQSFNKFMEHNLRLVINVAKDYRGCGVDFMDLINEGNIGLHTAIKKFDPHRGKFSTYGTSWIRQRILKYINNHGKTIRLPAYLYPKLKILREEREKFFSEHNKEPSSLQLEKLTGVPESKIRQLLAHIALPLSLEKKINGGGTSGVHNNSESTLSDIIENNGNTALQDLLLSENTNMINDALKNLSKRERYVIERRFGLNGTEKQTLELIGKKFKLTRERIRQVEAEALNKIKIFFKKKKFNLYERNN